VQFETDRKLRAMFNARKLCYLAHPYKSPKYCMYKPILFASLVLMAACSSKNAQQAADNPSAVEQAETPPKTSLPSFNADSAYQHISTQVAFGPRVPGSEAQLNCAAWMQAKLADYCDTVYRQQTTVTAGDGKTQLRCINIIGAINPQAKRRILLLAHWDSRPWADRDAVNKDKPIDAADDGASGVGVLIELARAIGEQPLPTDIGVDILMTDVEDWGKAEWGDDSYALGTQYWARNPHVTGYTAEAGILLDMVGAKDARFPIEGNSQRYARHVLVKVWQAASDAGFSNYFVYEPGGAITDDHVPINEIAKIPTIDIINLPKGSSTGFVSHWHTHHDNMDNIDRNTLKAVGQTLLQFLYTL
jgi:glutaminyl-peptide cyclotransferase